MTTRVVVADDSPIFREVLRHVLEAEGDVSVVGEAGDGHAAVELVRSTRPDILFLDLQMPALGGLETIEELMASHPLPIVLITAQPAGPGATLVFEAMRRGALEVQEKSVVALRPDSVRALTRRLALVPVVMRPRQRPVVSPPSRVTAPVAPSRGPAPPVQVVGIGASAGGPPAVAAVLSSLPRGVQATFAVVQHLTPGFADGYARFLQDHCALPVRLVTRAVPWEPGVVFVAPDEKHLGCAQGRLTLSSEGTWPFRPSVDALFVSLASVLGRAAAGVVLSGMGNDGAEGLAALHRTGAQTFVQDEESSRVFGMPRAAAQRVPQARVLPLSELGPALAASMHRSDG